MQQCWKRKCHCHNFEREAVSKPGFMYLHRLTCPDCRTVWWDGLRDDDVQVRSNDEPEVKTETEEVAG